MYPWKDSNSMRRIVLVLVICCILVVFSGCLDVKGDDYQDSPPEIQDGSLDYQDYKEADCPYLGNTLDQETMEKCNEWIRENETSSS